jgi:hypothetical protein
MKENVISPIRQIAGLGSPPEFYTQNVAECCNRVIKADAGHKKGWSDFCLSIQETAELQEREMKRAIHQGGEYRLASAFQHLEVKAGVWVDMDNAQREAHYKRCFSKPLDKLAKVDDDDAGSGKRRGSSQCFLQGFRHYHTLTHQFEANVAICC